MRPPSALMAAAVVAATASLVSTASPGAAQAIGTTAEQMARIARIEVTPPRVELTVGESAELTARAVDRSGGTVEVAIRAGAPRDALRFDEGRVSALRPGEHTIVFSVVPPAEWEGDPPRVSVPVLVRWPAVARVEIEAEPGTLYAGTSVSHFARALHPDGSERPEPDLAWRSSDPAIARVDRFGTVTAVSTGRVRISARIEGVIGEVEYEIPPFPAASLEITGGEEVVRTGDVQSFAVVARDEEGRPLADLPITWSFSYEPAPGIVAPAGPGLQEGPRIVADVPGIFTVHASAGPLAARRSFEALPRDAVRRVEVVGQGRESRVFTTDLWIWEGVDGRDYALTGSKNGDGVAFVWDVTDPANIFKTDSIMVDARTVNDVKVAPHGRWGALSREGASDRRNGVVVLDLSDPAHPTIASEYDEGLTGGVHNMYATETHLFALSNGDKYVILDMSDLTSPRYVSEYDHPESRVHDVWVHDGIAYSAEWGTGVVVVDVGNGRWGGSVESPVLVTTYPLPTGQTHAVFPYHQESTGRFYLVVGDEIVNRRGLAWEGTGPDHRQQYDPETGTGGYPRATSGYIQFVDFTDPEDPRMVARYEVSEYGTHNMWVEDDILYQAYYEGGLRMVDISGDLMGNLYTQGREIAVFKAHDPIGYIPNAPAAWGVMPWKGHIFFADINSGLWAVRLQPRGRPVM